jgi:hypothetical protein
MYVMEHLYCFAMHCSSVMYRIGAKMAANGPYICLCLSNVSREGVLFHKTQVSHYIFLVIYIYIYMYIYIYCFFFFFLLFLVLPHDHIDAATPQCYPYSTRQQHNYHIGMKASTLPH